MSLPSRFPWRPLTTVLLASALLAAALPAGAIDAISMELEDLMQVSIVSTPKFAENPERIPSVVSIISAADIRLYGWRTLGAALRSLQGFNVTDDHTYAYGGVRGISQPGDYRPRQQILIDGQAMNENIYASAPADSAFPLDIGLIERIEVIRGPSAAIYGGDAMFGVINVVTRSGPSVGGEAALKLGSGADRRLRLFRRHDAALVSGIVSACCVAIYTMWPKKLQEQYPTPMLQGWAFLMGGIMFSLIFRPWQIDYVPTAMGVFGIFTVVVLGNVLAFSLYMSGVPLIGPQKASLYSFAEPVTAAIISTLVLGSPFTLWDALGFGCIFLMLVLLSLPAKQKN